MPTMDAILDAPPDVDVTGGGDDASDNTDNSTDTNDTGTDDSSSDESGSSDVVDDPADGTTGDSGTADANTKLDGRKLPDAWKKAFADKPEELKKLKGLFYSHAEYKKAFDSPAKLNEFLADIETSGGLAGLKEASTALTEIDTAIAAGDPKIVEKFAAAEGFNKLVPSVIEAFAKASPAEYTQMVATQLHDTLDQSGFIRSMDQLKTLVADDPQAKALLDQMSGLLGGIQKLATTAPAAPEKTPAMVRFEKDKSDFESQKQQAFITDLQSSIRPVIDSGIKTALAPYTKGRTLDKEQQTLLEKNVGRELDELLRGDTAFLKQRDAHKASGDKVKTLKVINAAIEKHLPEAAKRVGRVFGSGQPKAAPRKEATPARDATTQRMSTPPPAQDVDWSRTSQDSYLDGIAYLKSGRKVTF